MFWTFLWKSIVWMTVGGIIFQWMIGILIAIPTAALGVFKSDTIKRIVAYILFVLMVYGLSIISGFFSIRSSWYVSQEGVEHSWIYHIISVVLVYSEITFIGMRGSKNIDDQHNVANFAFLSIPLTIVYIYFSELPKLLYPFLVYWF